MGARQRKIAASVIGPQLTENGGIRVETPTRMCQRFTTRYGRRGAKGDCASNAAMSSAL
jgi:hypothetical protein